jgi:alkylation response protein AidB-like acyl-CoA dehydrogenase
MQQPRGEETGPIERARALKPLVAAASDEIEQIRQLPERVFKALSEAGLFHMMVPRAIGGGEVHPAIYGQALEQIAQGDASTAWSIGQNSGCSMSAAYLAPEVARECFAPPHGILAWGPFAPTAGRGVAVDGGYKVTGKWGFASGSRHARWLGCHVHLYEADGTQRKTPEGRPVLRTMVFPKTSATVIDNWQVIGLRGTGSDSYEINDLYVPQKYSFARDAVAELRETGTLYKFTSGMMYAVSFSFVSLGMARASLDEFTRYATERKPRFSERTIAHNNVVQGEVAKADAKLRASRAFILEAIEALWEEAGRGNRGNREQLRQLRLACTWAINQAQEVVNMAYNLAGAQAIFSGHPLERRMRDIHAGTQQGQGRPVQFEHVGQVMLGLEPEGPLFR